ncbi:MAG: hypothetical protein M3144_02010 [Actinomycetota bacterium]|nr:hypothetical protein [Actinomycetota bacterium]
MKRVGVVLIVPVLLLAAACGQATPAEKAARETADHLGEIRSGQLLFKLVAGSGDSQVGFELEGPFALPAPGALPVARIDYTQIAGGRETTTEVIATGANAYVGIDGTVYELPPAQVESLRAPKDSKDDGLGALRIDDWIDDPRLGPGEEVDGVATERIQGPVDVVRTLNDLFAFGRQAGASDLAVPEIKGDDADQLRRVTQAATVDLLTGRDDRFLRRMAVDIRLAAQVPERVTAALGDLAAATIRFDLAVNRPNTPVQVPEPTGARPASAIPRPG